MLATSVTHQQLVRVDAPGSRPTTHPLSVPRDGQLAAAGDRAVLLDAAKHRLLRDDGSTVSLPASVTGDAKLQQSGADGDEVAIATGSGVVVVAADGGVRTHLGRPGEPGHQSHRRSRRRSSSTTASTPHGRERSATCWPATARTRAPSTSSRRRRVLTLEFRVNRSVVALNDLDSGNVWLLDDQMRLVKNWQEVTPPQQDDTEDGDQKASTQSFEDTLADRTDVNRPPIARDDNYGVRPGRTTILPVLANDTDPDGDVLTIPKFTSIPEYDRRRRRDRRRPSPAVHAGGGGDRGLVPLLRRRRPAAGSPRRS